jgi:hypothetical protein
MNQYKDIEGLLKERRSAPPPGRASVEVPTGLPPCPGLRGEACQPYVNRTAKALTGSQIPLARVMSIRFAQAGRTQAP